VTLVCENNLVCSEMLSDQHFEGGTVIFVSFDCEPCNLPSQLLFDVEAA
jgi:hypothetical protein